MIIIGIVGGSGAGKTTALQELAALDVELLDCDAVYHQLLAHSVGLQEAIQQRFGDVFDDNGLNRRKLGALVFGDAQALRDLNAITLGYIEAELRHRMEDARSQGRRGVAVDGATLLESKLAEECDALVAVVAPDGHRIKRIMARDGISEQAARERIAAQRSQDWLCQRCGYVLENDGSVEDFRGKCRELFETILTEN